METRSARDIWEAALGELQIQVSKSNYRTWLEKTEGLSYQDSHLVVSVPNIFVAEYLDKNQRSLIEKSLMNITSAPSIKLSFVVNGKPQPCPQVGAPDCALPTAPKLNPNYVFESFIVGKNNRVAYEAAKEVTVNPGHSYNPLFICGGVGLGKTHLLHAIGHVALGKHQRVSCVSAEQFTNEFINSVREKKTEEFRNKYRNLDMLLVDDVSFISGKEQTEECFFHTFNELHNAGRQMVITSSQPPKDLRLLDEKLRSRLGWGLVADIQPPDFETRLEILKAKAKQKEVDVTSDILELIAQQIKQNIRELEGSLNRVIAYAKLLQASPTLELAAQVLKNLNGKEPESSSILTPTLLLEAVAGSFQLTLQELKGNKRDKETSLARRVAMYLLRKESNFSLAQIGAELGGRDPSAVTLACKKIASEMESNNYLKRKIQDIQKRINF